MTALRVGVVGVGYLGRFHAQKLAGLDSADLIGVYDAKIETATAVAAVVGTAAFESYAALAEKIDAVSIAASTPAHYRLAKYFLEQGVHVFVEKPITETSAQAAELVNLADARRLKLQVGHIERFNPALLAAREHLHDIRFVECHRLAAFKTRGADVDVVLDLMIHDLDMVLSLIQADPIKVSAMGLPVLTKTVDIANARIEFDNGAVANVTASRVSTNAQRKFRAFQANQYLSIDFGTGIIQRVTSDGAWEGAGDKVPLNVSEWSAEKGDALFLELAAFVDAVSRDTDVPVPGRQGYAALLLAENILQCIEDGKR